MSLNEQQLEHIKSWQASGFSQTVYCQKNGLNKKTFSGWFSNYQALSQSTKPSLIAIDIEGKFGQGKRAYGLNQIQAKTARTSEAWINSIFFVMNLLVLLRHFFVPTIVQRCTNKFFKFLLQKTGRNITSPVNLFTKGYLNSWLLSF